MDLKKLLDKLTVISGSQVLNESLDEVRFPAVMPKKASGQSTSAAHSHKLDQYEVDPYEAGIRAGENEKSKHSNPYEYNDPRSYEWEDGWKEGARNSRNMFDESSKPDFLDIDKDGDKKEPMKKAAADKEKTSTNEEQVDEVGTLGAMAVGAAIQGNHMDHSKISAKYMKDKAGHYAQAPAKPKFNPYVFNVQQPEQNSTSSSASNMRNKAKFYSEDANKQTLDEESKPDFLDIDKDGDKKEPMKKAATDKKKQGVTEAKLGAIEAYGVRGMKSTPWRKTFKSQAAFEAWLEKNESNVEVHGTRKLDESVAESKLAECGGMSYDQDSGMSINTSVDTRTGSKTVSVTASGNSADDLMQILKLAGMNSDASSTEPTSSSVKVMSMPMGYGVFGHSHEDQEIEETYANEPDEQIQPVDTQLQQGTDLNRQKPMYKHSYRQGDNPMAMQEARELARLEKEIKEGIDSIKVKQPEHSGHRSAASAGSADSYYGRSRKPNKSENGVKIYNLTPEEIKAYNKAYDENEESQNFKDWGRDE